MATREHSYQVEVRWTGNRGTGTSAYRAYSRDHEVVAPGKPVLAGSADPAFRGDAARYNPEELLVASLAQCHMLWYLHLCADAGIVVTRYEDAAAGVMIESDDGSGRFERVDLRPRVTITDASRREQAAALHDEAHRLCFVANSVRFPVGHEPRIDVNDAPAPAGLGFAAWLAAYGTAWERGDAAAAADLFTPDAVYAETPFDPPMVGRDAIHRYWAEGAGESQTDVQFSFQLLAETQVTGIAAWQASFTRVPLGERVRLDGILIADFDDAGRCSRFREWWHRATGA